jgi:ligand-binding sensor domain-containing protein
LNGVHLKSIAAMPSENRILLAAAPHQMYKSIDAGLIWKPLPFRLIVPPTEPLKAPVSKSTAKASKSARKTVARKPVEKLREISPDEIHGLYTVKNGTKDLLFAATNLGLLTSADAGERWTMAEVAGSSPVTGLYVSPNFDGRLVARADAGLFLSKDFGEHWTSLNSPTPAGDVKDVALASYPTAPILVATRLGLFSSNDEGNKWLANPGGMPASTVNSVVYGSGTLAYAVQYGKLWESKDAGNSWSPLYSALPTTRIRRLWIPDLATNRLYGVTSDLGVLFRN